MKTFWLNFPFNNCNKSGGRWNAPSSLALPVPPRPSEWLWQLVVYRSRVLMRCHLSWLTCGSHSSVLNVGQGRSHSLTIWPLNLFSYLRTSWSERCGLVRLLYSTVTWPSCGVMSSRLASLRCFIYAQAEAVQVEQKSHVWVEHTQTRWTVFTSDYPPLSSYLLLTLT